MSRRAPTTCPTDAIEFVELDECRGVGSSSGGAQSMRISWRLPIEQQGVRSSRQSRLNWPRGLLLQITGNSAMSTNGKRNWRAGQKTSAHRSVEWSLVRRGNPRRMAARSTSEDADLADRGTLYEDTRSNSRIRWHRKTSLDLRHRPADRHAHAVRRAVHGRHQGRVDQCDHHQSNSGGHWGPELKFAGYDLLILSKASRRDAPATCSFTTIAWKSGRVGLLGAKASSETEDGLREEPGLPGLRVACIGPAWREPGASSPAS